MRPVRSPGQKLVPVPINEGLLRNLDDGLRKLAYSNRSQFVRDAIYEKLTKLGSRIPRMMAQAPDRIGKGGPRKKAAPMPRRRKARTGG